jgi:hypothetical protein
MLWCVARRFQNDQTRDKAIRGDLKPDYGHPA